MTQPGNFLAQIVAKWRESIAHRGRVAALKIALEKKAPVPREFAPALETSHSLAELIERAPEIGRGQIVILNLSGRGHKDMEFFSRHV